MSLQDVKDESDGPDTHVIRIHSNCVRSSRELWRELQTRCGAGNFKVEMRHDVYTIQVNKTSWNAHKTDLVRGNAKDGESLEPNRPRDYGL
jgi:hypothetical protein